MVTGSFLLVLGVVGVFVSINENARQRRADKARLALFQPLRLGALFNEGRDV